MRILAVNIGNSSLFGGIFESRCLKRCFRFPVRECSGLRGFSGTVAQEIRGRFDRVVLCSVVPQLTQPLAKLLSKATGHIPELLTAQADHGMKIAYHDPSRLGTDRLAAVLGARTLFPRRNLIVIDCGTATTVTVLSSKGVLVGGAIFPGLGLWSAALANGTAQLPAIKPAKPASPIGRSPEEAIASGLFYGHAGAIRELVKVIGTKAFGSAKWITIGTGGNAELFAHEKLFTKLEPNLILHGLRSFAAQNNDHAQDLFTLKAASRRRHVR